MLNPGAYAQIFDPDARTQTFDAPPCGHCGFIMMMKPGHGPPVTLVRRPDGSFYERDAGFCRACYRHVCPRCDGKPCVPYEKRIDDEEALARKARFACL